MTNSIQQALKDVLTTESMVDKHLGKPGLDIEEGRFIVRGSITLGKIFRRKRIGTNLAPATGYLLEDTTTGQQLLVEKQQGVDLCLAYGVRNAFIAYRNNRKTEEGEVLQNTPTIYLQPYPQRAESFTQDNRIRTAFKLDEKGNLIRPYELAVKEEECTKELWHIISVAYRKGSRVGKRSRKEQEMVHSKRMGEIREALRLRRLAEGQQE